MKIPLRCTSFFTCGLLGCGLLGTGLAACSSSSGKSATSTTAAAMKSSVSGAAAPSGSPQSVVNTTVAKTLATQTADVDLSLGVAGGTGATITGPFDLATGDGQLSLKITGLAAANTFPPTELLYDNGAAYLQATGMIASFDENKPWAQLTTPTVESIFCLLMPNTNTTTLSELATGDPAQLLDILNTPDMTVTAGGGATVGGTPITDYTVNIDAAQAEQGATGEAQTLFAAMAASGTTAPLTVGIDSKGVLHSLTASFTTSGKVVRISLALSGYGVASHVTAPTAAQIGQLNVPGAGCGTTTTAAG